MSKKNTNLLTIRSRQHLSVVELHSVARDAAAAAATREAEGLERALELIEEAERLALAVSETAATTLASVEARAAAIALTGASTHLRAAVSVLKAAT